MSDQFVRTESGLVIPRHAAVTVTARQRKATAERGPDGAHKMNRADRRRIERLVRKDMKKQARNARAVGQ